MNKRNKSIFRIILSGMLILLGITLILIMGYLQYIRLPGRLNRNACDILQKQVNNRQTYLEGTILKNHNLIDLSDKIDQVVMDQISSGEISLETLDSQKDSYVSVLQNVSQDMIDTLRSKDVTGIYVVLNTHDMDEMEDNTTIPGLYIRDLDPDATPSYRNADLLLERSPMELVQSMLISTDKSWKAFFTRGPIKSYNFIYPSFQTAYEDKAQLEESDYGHLTASSYMIRDDDRAALAYSIPLILPDGTVYGVLGVEMLESYVQSLLPAEELENGQSGIYYLAHTEAAELKGKVPFYIATSSSEMDLDKIDTVLLEVDTEQDYWTSINGEKYYATIQPLEIYNRNTPFSNEKWYLIGMVPTSELFFLSREITIHLWILFLVSIWFGGLCCMFFSRKLSFPFRRMREELLEATNRPDNIPKFTQTNIRELEQFASAITTLSKEIVDTSTKFLKIMQMASMELGGYEVRYDTDSVYVTDNFFNLLGIDGVKDGELTPIKFHELLNSVDKKYSFVKSASGGKIYRIADEKGNVRYIHLKKSYLEYSQVGIVEDETDTTLEQIRIKYERDYDTLTEIYNRRAVQKKYHKIFEKTEQLKHAAVIMIDLDNLKYINDNFGHEYGDQYIQTAAHCLSEILSVNSLYGRISGDEFFVFLYGYDTKEELQKVIDHFINFVKTKYITLPDGTSKTIGMSGGIAWYREHAESPQVLKKYADFAMYQMKRNKKGHFGVFNLAEYKKEVTSLNLHEEFMEMIRNERISYHFQPIVSAKTGKTEAYEALMRSEMATLRNPMEILKIARETSHLHDIERLTVFKSVEAFWELRQNGKVTGNEMLFINTISSQCLTDEEEEAFIEKFSELQEQIVIEITEQDVLDIEILEKKRNFKGFPKKFALDDYGSGYSNDKTLLELMPEFIKLDRSLIHNIDKDVNKQQLVSYAISYAHLKGIRVIAEGIENAGELKKLLELNVDLLQGFYIGRPKAEPKAIDPEVVEIIRMYEAFGEIE